MNNHYRRFFRTPLALEGPRLAQVVRDPLEVGRHVRVDRRVLVVAALDAERDHPNHEVALEPLRLPVDERASAVSLKGRKSLLIPFGPPPRGGGASFDGFPYIALNLYTAWPKRDSRWAMRDGNQSIN